MKQETNYSNMPKWNVTNYGNWNNWAKACYDAGKDAAHEENNLLKQQVNTLREALDMVTRVFIYSSKGEFKAEHKIRATQLAVKALLQNGITEIGQTFTSPLQSK